MPHVTGLRGGDAWILGPDPGGRLSPHWGSGNAPILPGVGLAMGSPLSLYLEDFGMLGALVHDPTVELQGVVASVLVTVLPPPETSAPSEKVASLYLLHLRIDFIVSGDAGLSRIWEEVAQCWGQTEGLDILNQALLRGILSFRNLEGGSTSVPHLLAGRPINTRREIFLQVMSSSLPGRTEVPYDK